MLVSRDLALWCKSFLDSYFNSNFQKHQNCLNVEPWTSSDPGDSFFSIISDKVISLQIPDLIPRCVLIWQYLCFVSLRSNFKYSFFILSWDSKRPPVTAMLVTLRWFFFFFFFLLPPSSYQAAWQVHAALLKRAFHTSCSLISTHFGSFTPPAASRLSFVLPNHGPAPTTLYLIAFSFANTIYKAIYLSRRKPCVCVRAWVRDRCLARNAETLSITPLEWDLSAMAAGSGIKIELERIDTCD